MASNNINQQGSQNRIRLRILLPAVMLPVLAILIFVPALRSHPPTAQHTDSSNAPAPSNSATASTPIIHSQSYAPVPAQGTEPETERLTSMMLDKALSLQMRRQAARSLAKLGTDEAMASLKAALTTDTPPYVKAAIAEGLGGNPSQEARDLLHSLANDKNETLARAAARGLAARGDADAVQTLGNLLNNEQTPLSVRTESALALGDVDLPGAQDLLTKAVSQIQNDDVVESALDGLGRRPFSETEDFFRNYLDSTNVSPDFKILAIEAVTDSDGDDVAPFLTKYLKDSEPKVREAAKSALDFLGPSPENASE
ncbi:MAG TPA: HEAT repeat domain-containing protein [Candidatus Polarisedimenticolia bacterium]|nr:HEAT repeat domain-containing protein [Candidatus Polarisedimenticolia bacterium]